MEQMTSLQDQLNQIIQGHQTDILVGSGSQIAFGAAAAAIVIGLLICFLGLKLVKVLGALVGFFLGAAIGGAAGFLIGLDGLAFAGVVVAGGIIFGLLSWFLYRIGVFLLVLVEIFGVAVTILKPESWILAAVGLAVALVLAILAVIYVEPFVIVVTGLAGGIAAGSNIALLAGLNDTSWIGLAAGAVIAVIGIIVQFMMQSRKVGKKEKNYSEKIKEQDSMESEVEKARHLLDDDDDDDLQD